MNTKLLGQLFLTFAKVGVMTFGGGYAMIALLEEEFIQRRKWLDKDEFLDMAAGDDAELAAYRHAWDELTAMDERLAKLRSQEASARQQADYLRESIARIDQVDPQPGEDAELKERRDRIENAAAISQGVSSALAVLDASQMSEGSDAASAVDLVNRAAQALHGIQVGGVFAEQASRLESIAADLADVVFALVQELDGEGSVEDLDRLNGRIHELNELMRRWGPELSDVIAWRDKAVFEVEDLDASPEKVAQLESEREQLYHGLSMRPKHCMRCGCRPRAIWGCMSARNLDRWLWAAPRCVFAWPNMMAATAPQVRSDPMAATTSNSCSRRFPARPNCRWAKARPAVSSAV